MQKDDIIINSIKPNYTITGYSEELKSPVYKLISIETEFILKSNPNFSGKYDIITKITLTEEEIKDKIIEVLE